MAPFFIRTQNKPRSLEPSPASVGSMTPVALTCVSVLIFLACLSSGIVLIHRRRLRHRNQSTTQVEAEVQLPGPVASQSEEKVENVSLSSSTSSKSCDAVPLLPSSTAPRSGSTAAAKNPVEKLVFKTSAALSKGDKYTTLPLRRARQARQAQIEQKRPTLDFSTSQTPLDPEIVSAATSSVPAREVAHQFSSMRSTSLTSGTGASSSTNTNTSSRSELRTYSRAVPPGNSGQSALRPSPTVVSMEARPLEADAAALPDAETMFVSGSLPSFSSIPSLASLPTVCQPAIERHTRIEDEASKHPHSGLDCETPPKKEHRTPGTPSSSSTSVSTVIATGDSSFASDSDTVCEVGLGKVPISGKAFKLDEALPLSVSVFNLSFDLSSGKGNDAIGLHPNSGSDGLSSLTKY